MSAVSGHMTRKMWDLIPVLDCSQLLKLCPSQCKPSVCPTATPGPRSDRPQRAMAGKHRAGTSADIRGGLTPTGTRPLRNQDRCCAKNCRLLTKYSEIRFDAAKHTRCDTHGSPAVDRGGKRGLMFGNVSGCVLMLRFWTRMKLSRFKKSASGDFFQSKSVAK